MTEATGGKRVGHFAVHFDTDRFDLTQEPENDINPIRGHSFLAWLRPRLEEQGYSVEGPDTEDWGWYLCVERQSVRSIVGATAWQGADGRHSWMLQVSRWRTLSQWLRRAPKMKRDDPLLHWIEEVVATLGSEETWIEEG